MTGDLRIVLVQAASGADPAASRALIDGLLADVTPGSADLILTPEMTPFCGPRAQMAERAEEIGGPTTRWAAAHAARTGALFVVGSMIEKTPTPGRYRNTGVAIAPDGREVARYSKLHRFDVSIPGQVEFRESDAIDRGPLAPTVFSWGAWQIGWAICYDLRFPEVFFPPAGASAAGAPELWLLPSAFTRATGVRHWRPLLQARAIESFAWIAAANQTGPHPNGLESFGHSAVYGPDGDLAAALDGESGTPGPPALLRATLTRQRCHDLRQRIPALQHRLARVSWPGGAAS